jgi:hypothetical protein
MTESSTRVGRVVGVSGAEVTAELLSEVVGFAHLVQGELHRLGQIGSLVKIPVGYVDMIGIVTSVGVAAVDDVPEGERTFETRRTLRVALAGEKSASSGFRRGISTYPTVGDEIHVLREDEARSVFELADAGSVRIGSAVSSRAAEQRISVQSLLTRHAAVVGATGSGKSNAVAVLIDRLSTQFGNSFIAVFDVHGEYAKSFAATANIYRIGDAHSPLVVPHWVLPFDDFVRTFCGGETSPVLHREVEHLKQQGARHLKAGEIERASVTVDTPVPFDLRRLWWRLEWRDRQTLTSKAPPRNSRRSWGSLAGIKPPLFDDPSPMNTAPYQGPEYGRYRRLADRLRTRLQDPRYRFMTVPEPYNGIDADLSDLVSGWHMGSRLTIFDLSLLPSDVLDVVVGTVARLLLDYANWERELADEPVQPRLVVFEEAHRYLRQGVSGIGASAGSRAVERLLMEGRKHGVGAVIVSQRPSELSDVVLSQCATVVALRLGNTLDQAAVRGVLSDELRGVTDLLSGLRTGEALIVGEAVNLPVRVRVDRFPRTWFGADPDVVEAWSAARPSPDPSAVVTAWRRQYAAARTDSPPAAVRDAPTASTIGDTPAPKVD